MGLRFFASEPKFKFVARRQMAFVLSAVMLVVAVGSLATRGLNFGVDFAGGVLITLQFPEQEFPQGPNVDDIRRAVDRLNLGPSEVQPAKADVGSGFNAVLIRVRTSDAASVEGVEPAEDQASVAVLSAVRELYPTYDIANAEISTVGPRVAEELVVSGILAVTGALFLMLVYIWFRFDSWRFSVGAVAALVHDVVITLGMFSLMQFEFGLPIVAAILTIVGYSMNDTVVVFDRIREELRRYKSLPLPDVLDLSVNRTLSRTIVTSVTTLLSLVALFVIAGEGLRGFSFAMIFGVLIGTYSSIFIAAPFLMITGLKRVDEQGGVETAT